MVGIILALVFRAIFIALGYQLIENFSFVFYVFGAFLVYTAVRLAIESGSDEEEEYQENGAVRTLRRVLPIGPEYVGADLTTRVSGRRLFTPTVVVIASMPPRMW